MGILRHADDLRMGEDAHVTRARASTFSNLSAGTRLTRR